MIDQLKEHISEVEQFSADSTEALEAFRIKYLGKKGILNKYFAEFKNVPKEDKKAFGQTINQLKTAAT
ncbi:MAG: phenylalanine--tRNA ligase subunit alpha, partial [Bacteroidota bacterium]